MTEEQKQRISRAGWQCEQLMAAFDIAVHFGDFHDAEILLDRAQDIAAEAFEVGQS